MRGGATPIHIQRWAPADFHEDEHVKLLKARRDYRTLTFYRHFIDRAFAAGGDLPADPEALAAVVEMPRKDVEAALVFCLGRLIHQDGDRLYQARVRRDVAEEMEFRAQQIERGRAGGLLAGKGRQKAVPIPAQATPIDNDRPPLGPREPNPPSPFASALRQTPDADAVTPPTNGAHRPTIPAREGPKPNPLMGERTPWERECLDLVARMAKLTGEDPVDVIARASGYEGAQTTKLNPASMTDDRLMHTVRDLRADVAAEEKKRGTA